MHGLIKKGRFQGAKNVWTLYITADSMYLIIRNHNATQKVRTLNKNTHITKVTTNQQIFLCHCSQSSHTPENKCTCKRQQA